MKAQELRVGNFILGNTGVECVRMILGHEGYKNNPEIHEIYKHLIGVEENGNSYNLGEIKPIPLTEEWPLRFDNITPHRGWYSFSYGGGNGNVGVIIIRIESYGIFIEPCAGYRKLIGTVHAFQNFIFALTGEELTLKP